MTTNTTTDHRATWDAYSAIWSLTDDEARREALDNALAETCVYTDPTIQAEGHEAVIHYMRGFQQMLPGGGFQVTGFVHHHDQSLSTWNMVDGDGNVAGTGTSAATYGPTGLLTSMTGFFDTPADS